MPAANSARVMAGVAVAPRVVVQFDYLYRFETIASLTL
jgi:hypothetical protein